MRYFILSIIVLSAASSISGQAEWQRLETGTLAWLRALHFTNEESGWIGGTAGTLLRTEDGGRTWRNSESPTKDDIRDIYFSDARRGWLLCESDIFGRGANSPAYILVTNDSGVTWDHAEVEPGPERMLRFVGGSNGELRYVLGEMGTMLKASSDGKRFTRTRLAGQTMLSSGKMLDAKHGIIVGGLATIIVTEDDGATWNPASVAGGLTGLDDTPRRTGRLNSVFFLDSQKGWAAGNAGTILATVNRGRNWRSANTGTESDLNDVLFLDEQNGVAAGNDGTLLTTADGGETWKKEVSGTKHRLERLGTVKGRIFAIGFGGILLTKITRS